MEKMIFQTHPIVEFGTNIFIDCPTILQFDDTPLIQIKSVENVGFATSIPIYHEDGTYLARAVGSQLHLTQEGKKAGVQLLHPPKATICTMGTQILFEIKRTEANGLKASAELYTPSGFFVKYASTSPSLINPAGEPLKVGGLMMQCNTLVGCRIGVWLQSNGSVAICQN